MQHSKRLIKLSNYPRRLYSRRRGWGVHSRLSVCLHSKTKMALATNSPIPNLLHIYSIEVTQHALTQRSKGQRSRSDSYEKRQGRIVASDACCYGHVLLLAWVSMSIRLHMFSSFYSIQPVHVVVDIQQVLRYQPDNSAPHQLVK